MSHYKFEEKEYPSVTDILGSLDKPGVSYWSVNCVIRKGEMLLREGMSDMMELLTIAQGEPERQKQLSMKIGTWMHEEMLEEYGNRIGVQTGRDDWINKEENIFERGGGKKERFFGEELERWGNKVKKNISRWSERNVKRWIEMERPVVHEGLRYAGTPDFLVEDREGRIVLGDLKVNKQVL